jgi:hypothetical protein
MFTLIIMFFQVSCNTLSQDIVVSIAISYVFGGPGFESPRDFPFSKTVHIESDAHPASYWV